MGDRARAGGGGKRRQRRQLEMPPAQRTALPCSADVLLTNVSHLHGGARWMRAAKGSWFGGWLSTAQRGLRRVQQVGASNNKKKAKLLAAMVQQLHGGGTRAPAPRRRRCPATHFSFLPRYRPAETVAYSFGPLNGLQDNDNTDNNPNK